MSQSPVQKAVNTFIKGLITEASTLTFPDNASIDELNCTLERSGIRRRRKGVTFEDNYALSNFPAYATTTVLPEVNAELYTIDDSVLPSTGNVSAFTANTPSKTFGAINGSPFYRANIHGWGSNVIALQGTTGDRDIVGFYIDLEEEGYDASSFSIQFDISPSGGDVSGIVAQTYSRIRIYQADEASPSETVDSTYLSKGMPSTVSTILSVFDSGDLIIGTSYTPVGTISKRYISVVYEGWSTTGASSNALELFSFDPTITRDAGAGTKMASAIHNETWKSVGNTGAVDFEVIQVNDHLYFYDKSYNDMSNHKKSFFVNMNDFKAVGSESINTYKFDGDSVNGNFVVVHPSCDPFYIEYDQETDTITTGRIVVKIRDFEYQTEDKETLLKDTTGAAISDARLYDTYNSGWYYDDDNVGSSVSESGTISFANTVLAEYRGFTGRNPRLTHPWYSAKEGNGDFFAAGWGKVYSGNNLSGNGHFILDLFNKDRASLTNIYSLETEIINKRFTSVTAYAGRVWYSGIATTKESGRVYFSKVIEENKDFGICYQTNDPTAEDFSDLLDSDGGVINIPDARNIKALFTYGSTILVFAENGVWEIGGVDQVFKATEYYVHRVSSVGVLNKNTFVDAEGTPIWWGTTGIFTINKDNADATSQGSSLSINTIQTFWEEIPVLCRNEAYSVYDEINRKILWLYSDDDSRSRAFNRILILDLVLEAFYPWKISEKNVDSTIIMGGFYFNGLGAISTPSNVVVVGDPVQVNGDTVEVSTLVLSKSSTPKVKFVVVDTASNKLTFAEISTSSLQDWGTETYESFAVAGYDYKGDLSTMKSPMYITTVMAKIPDSSLTLKTFWDYKSNLSSETQLYRNTYRRDDIVITRNRIRGRGRVCTLRFEGEAEKDFALHGYEVIDVKNNGL